MTTEYYQVPSQQGFVSLSPALSRCSPALSRSSPSLSRSSLSLSSSAIPSADPWLASATASTLAISSPSMAKRSPMLSPSPLPPSLFEPGDLEAAVSWKNVVPLKSVVGGEREVKLSPVVPRERFNSLSLSSPIDAWSVVADTTTPVPLQPTKNSNKQVKQVKQQQQQQQPAQQLQAKQVKQIKERQQQEQEQQAPEVVVQQTQQQPQQQQQEVLVAEEKPLEEELTQQNRYKTELCKSYTETGNCRYGNKCQFAHGKEDIRPVLRHPKYKTEICKTFHTTGTCPYGMRCRFIHTRSKEQSIVATPVSPQPEEQDDDETNEPQWSKSWTNSMAPGLNKHQRRAAATVAAPEPSF